VIGQLGPRMRQVVGIGDCHTGRDSFRNGHGASHCNQREICAKVREAIELSFGWSVEWPAAFTGWAKKNKPLPLVHIFAKY